MVWWRFIILKNAFIWLTYFLWILLKMFARWPIHRNGVLVACCETYTPREHTKAINRLIMHVLEIGSIKITELHAVAIGKGPGSYTGLRIASATAKGLCEGLEVPLLAVSSLKAMALSIQNPNVHICPLIDARRMEVFAALFDGANNHEVIPVHNALITPQFMGTWLEKVKIWFVGSGAEKTAQVITHRNAWFGFFAPIALAKYVGYLAHSQFVTQQFESVESFEPHYVKEFYSPTKAQL
jgi:Inactive homolog of metal-dependent proteases, putative molecular chaperone